MGKLSAIKVEQWRKAGKPITGKSDGDLAYVAQSVIFASRGRVDRMVSFSFLTASSCLPSSHNTVRW